MRVLFVSHTFPLPGEPLSNVGGMQRRAVAQRAAREAHPQVELTSLVLESSSRWTELRTAPFLARLLWQIPTIVRRRRIDVVLFSSMVNESHSSSKSVSGTTKMYCPPYPHAKYTSWPRMRRCHQPRP